MTPVHWSFLAKTMQLAHYQGQVRAPYSLQGTKEKAFVMIIGGLV
jgi:hypothetical protein